MDLKRLANLLALATVLKVPAEAIGEPTKLLAFEQNWHVRAALANLELDTIGRAPGNLINEVTFIEPIADVLRKKVFQWHRIMLPGFTAEFEIVNGSVLAQVRLVGELTYKMEIGTRLLSQLFLAAISMSQPGSASSESYDDPYRDELVPGAISAFESQSEFLKAMRNSVFHTLLPAEDWRVLLASSLVINALEYALMHEFTHAAFGHIEFLMDRDLGVVRDETNSRRGNVEPLTHQRLESDADDGATLHLLRKWKVLSDEHDFRESPLLLNRFGFAAPRKELVHLTWGLSVTMLFCVLDAAARGVQLDADQPSQGPAMYPTSAYRAWRFSRFQVSHEVCADHWKVVVSAIRSDLAQDGFPSASTIFHDHLDHASMEAYDAYLMAHSRENPESLALSEHVRQRASSTMGSRPMMPDRPVFWSEKPTTGLLRRLFQFFRRRFDGDIKL